MEINTRKPRFLAAATLLLSGLSHSQAQAETEITGNVTAEMRYFFQDTLYEEQSDIQASLVFEPEFYKVFNDGNDSVLFKPFLRVDGQDSERTHADIRELMWLHLGDDWELRTGIGKVFWGQAESLHLVDVINQTDLIEAVDAEEKLGQPMVNLSLIRDWGTTSFFVLPYFRERTFAGIDGRLRLPLAVDTDDPLYESSAEEHHIDWAVRWQHTLGDWEVGLSYFDGTSREPDFFVDSDLDGITLRPFYPQMQQVGLELLAVVDAWLLKFEGIHRDSMTENFFAAVGGFEYTTVGIFESRFDVGWLMEYQYDERDDEVRTPAQNDLMVGSRVAFNDFDGTEILIGIVQDLEYSASRSAFVEASSRINDNWKWRLEAYLFSPEQSDIALFPFRRDDFVQFNLEYYF